MRLSLDTLMTAKAATKQSKDKGVSLGLFTSPVNGEQIELLALYAGNKKTGDMIQLSVIPKSWDIADGSTGREAICGSCPHNKLGSCYAYDQGLFTMRKQGLKGAYKPMSMELFLEQNKGKKIRFGRFGDLSLLPYEVVKTLADNSGGFTGYTNQWRSKHYDPRFNELFMLSTLGEKDSLQARTMFPSARQFQVIHTEAEYLNDINEGVITCASENGYNCDECLLCDGQAAKTADVDIQIKAHGLDYKSKRINRLLKSDLINIKTL